MKRTLLLLLLTLGLSCTTALAVPKTPKKMKAFTSERELRSYFRNIAEKQKRAEERRRQMYVGGLAETVDVSSSTIGELVTNTQHEGIDEGDIVKVHGDHLIMLRRGRLFTVAIGAGALRPVSAIDAFGKDIDPEQSWYDEMLVYGDTIVVIGYSYQRGGTEVGLFNIDEEGKLTYRSTYDLRSNDYYSSRNYASRLIGSKLIFYSPLYFYAGRGDGGLFESLPAVRKWHKDAKPSEFRRIVNASRVYLPEMELDVDEGVTLHTVTICDLANGGFDCEATSVVGPPGHVFYVSPDSVYVWVAQWSNNQKQSQLVFRLPLDGSGPGALRVSGAPVDQFSFFASDDRYLNVLVRAESTGDGMWRAEVAEGDVAFMRVPLSSFSDGSTMVPATSYRQLPSPEGYYFQNRFVGDYVIYGTGSDGGYAEGKSAAKDLFLLDWARGTLHKLNLPHGVDRIEPMGTGAVVIGTDEKDLHFTSIRLDKQPAVVSRYTRQDASQGETRSHGFFYKLDGKDSGTLGLPISKPGRSRYNHLFETSATLLLLRNDGFQFNVLGELDAQPDKAEDDNCRASCVDWYGNARPLFLRGRVLALLGYELVEGKVGQGRITELRRISYGPRAIDK